MQGKINRKQVCKLNLKYEYINQLNILNMHDILKLQDSINTGFLFIF